MIHKISVYSKYNQLQFKSSNEIIPRGFLEAVNKPFSIHLNILCVIT